MKTDIKISKQLSFWLRHQPEDAGLDLSPDGWTDIVKVLTALRQRGFSCDRPQLDRVVETNDKKRYEISPDGTMIRARQGHSIQVDLGLPNLDPPAVLFHGTATRFLPAIQKEGLKPMKRHHVHLSGDKETAIKVGARHGKPAVLEVSSRRMHAAGHAFFCTENGVWLTDHVPPAFLTLVLMQPEA